MSERLGLGDRRLVMLGLEGRIARVVRADGVGRYNLWKVGTQRV